MKIKNFEDWLVENAQIGKTSIDNTGGFIYPMVVSEEELSNYMFFSNLKRIKELTDMLLKMDSKKIDDMLNNGHDWANDHITKSKETLTQVFEFFQRENLGESVTESNISDFNRVYSMSPTWWIAWKEENKENEYSMKQDAFSKTYEVKKGEKLLFIFDYSRNRIFTNESPEMFTLKDNISPKELEKIEKKADILQNKAEPKKEGDDKKEKKEKDPLADLGI
jgi:hypothetical protein